MQTVVLVDDDDGVREALVDALELSDYCVLACDGAGALEMLRSAPRPCVALLDLVMPQVDGWTLMRRICDDDELRHVPVIACSAQRESEVPAGCVAFLRKPFTEGQLLTALQAAFDTLGG